MTPAEERAAENAVMLADEPLTPEQEADYEAYVQEMMAIEEGRAMRVVHCYLCHLEATGHSDNSPKSDLGPFRGITRTYTSKGFDPYEVMVLTPCGHSII